jgi:Chondroitinase B
MGSTLTGCLEASMLEHSYLGSIASAAGTEAPIPAPAQANCFVESGADTVVVSSMSALQTAVNAASPGDNILIAPGTYNGGTLTFNRDGTEANPIVIRPQSGLGTVTINNARWTFANTSSWLVLSKLHHNGARITFMGDHNRITRHRFRDINTDAIIINDDSLGGARNCRIDHCEFSDFTFASGTGPAIRIRPTPFANGQAERILIDYCYFHDDTQDSAVINTFVPTPPTTVDLPRGSTIIMDHCLFDNIDRSGEYIVLKIGGWITRFCTFDNMNGYLQPRSGASNCEFRSNWFEGASHEVAKCWADNHLWIGNRFVGDIDLWVACGNASWEDLKDGTAPLDSYNPATNCEFIGNRFGSGHLRLGVFWSGCTAGGQVADLPADNNLLAANTRDSGGAAHEEVTTCLATSHTNTTISGTTEESFVPAVKLTAADVGLNAADPLCP